MQRYQHILVIVDLSGESASLIQSALGLGQIHQATLSLVHVIDYTPMLYASGEMALPVDLDAVDHSMVMESEHKLEQLAAGSSIAKEQCFLLRGDKEEEIVHFVQENKIDLIVVGAHDKRGLARIFGSTAQTLLHALPCDILSIKITTD